MRLATTNTISIKRAAPSKQDNPVFAVKFINKRYAEKYGRIKLKQLKMECSLHKHVGLHRNVIEFYQSGEDVEWVWIAMELAEGGDLFDKIEADSGVSEDVAHVYFSQLVSGITWMHAKGVAHRDIKPENILLSAEGDLKLADFGMATLFEYKGVRKPAITLCGSPPYVAPEVLSCSNKGSVKGRGYEADMADTWSCGVVLFVLLAGNTPWAKPVEELDEYGRPNEYADYVKTNGHPDDELWDSLPSQVLSLLRGMMRVDPRTRFTLENVRTHPWFTRPNPYMDKTGRLVDPVLMATDMFESLHVSFDADPLQQSQRRRKADGDVMELDFSSMQISRLQELAASQPVTPAEDMLFDWEKTSDRRPVAPSATQPVFRPVQTFQATQAQSQLIEDEPTMSQFSRNPRVPMSRTQMARKFHDILPNTTMAKFYSEYTMPLLIPLLAESLGRLGVPLPSTYLQHKYSVFDSECVIKIRTVDGRGCALAGSVMIDRVDEKTLELEFVKSSGDPLEWRRLFKRVVVLCKDAVFLPPNDI